MGHDRSSDLSEKDDRINQKKEYALQHVGDTCYRNQQYIQTCKYPETRTGQSALMPEVEDMAAKFSDLIFDNASIEAGAILYNINVPQRSCSGLVLIHITKLKRPIAGSSLFFPVPVGKQHRGACDYSKDKRQYGTSALFSLTEGFKKSL